MIYINKLNKSIFDRKISYILCDFDRTISTHDSSTSFGMFRQSDLVPVDYKLNSQQLFDKYRPMELNDKLELDIKKKMMRQWALEQIALFGKYGIDINLYRRIIEEKEAIMLRSDFQSFANDMYRLEIPIHIVSGGLLDPIVFTLQRYNCLFPNISITANRIKEKDGKILGLQEPVLHCLNKDSVFVPVSNSSLGLLFGDLPSDKLLATNLETINCGFVNDANVCAYNSEFDICLTGKSSFNQVSKLLIKK